MAQITLEPKALSCSICLELMKNPVTVPCGHSYCSSCVQSHWDTEKQLYSCPQCRFSHRSVIVKNFMLADLVEQPKKKRLKVSPADHCLAGPGDVSCAVCAGRKLKDVSLRLQCLVSFCKTHLQPNPDVVVLKKHQLVPLSHKLQENICSQHNRVKEIFCRSDQQLICYLCYVDQHKGHDTVSSAAERAQRQAELGARRDQLLQTVQDKEKDLERVEQEAQDISRSAYRALQSSGDSLTEMILLLKKRRSEVTQQIYAQEKTQMRPIEDLHNQLQWDIIELRRTISELDALFLTPDHNQFLQLYPSLSTTTQMPDSAMIQTGPGTDFEDVTRAVSELREKLQLSLSEFRPGPEVGPGPAPEPSSRKDFLKYSREITLDPNIAHTRLSLSDGNRRVTIVGANQSDPDHPDRFKTWQVLSREGLRGRCYWEVEWSGEKVFIAAAYKDTERHCLFGANNKSWALCCEKAGFSFWFKSVNSQVSGLFSTRIGVYLDHSAGALSFYSVQNQTMSLLHRVQSFFTQPLHPGVWVYEAGDTVHFSKLK